jgi:acyl-CoA reductase-like NAD-dependent aldehyde dehydrogenase
VIAIIAPGNYPFAIPVIQMLMALMAGNAVILKPSPHTPLVGQKIAELSRRANLPTGLLTVIHVADADAAHLTSHPGLNKIVFTGSVEVGRRVMASAAAVPTPVVLELGGKDAAIVAPDANIQRAARGIVWYSMANSGQTCAGVEQVFVHAGVYDRFVAEATALVESLRAGDGLSADVDVGPLQTHRQLELIEEHVEAAREQGARILTGGYRRTGSGLHYAPTVLAGVAPHMAIACEETFGPVLPITRVDSLEEAVQLVNASAYGLTASVWTENKALGLDLARRLRAGAVNINDHAFHFAEPGATWGGVGHSGFGRTTGLYGLMEMVAPKYISSDMGRAVAEAWWYPYDEHLLHFLRNAIRLLYGPLERRPWALLSLLLNPRTWQRVDLFRFARAIRKWL